MLKVAENIKTTAWREMPSMSHPHPERIR
jgi:hypothetical protein